MALLFIPVVDADEFDEVPWPGIMLAAGTVVNEEFIVSMFDHELRHTQYDCYDSLEYVIVTDIDIIRVNKVTHFDNTWQNQFVLYKAGFR